MPRQKGVKTDYISLKKEFMASKHTEVKSFLSDKNITYNSVSRQYTKGWSKEKQAIREKAAEKSLAKVEKKLAKQLEPSTEFLLGNITKAIELTQVKLEQMAEKGNINVKDLNTIWSMNRIQNNQPTTYVKSENENIEKIQGIHIVIGGNPIDSKENDKNNA